jgi:hypothetical protein
MRPRHRASVLRLLERLAGALYRLPRLSARLPDHGRTRQPPPAAGPGVCLVALWSGLGAIIVGTTIGVIGGAQGQRVALVVLALLVVAAALVEMTCRRFVEHDIARADVEE